MLTGLPNRRALLGVLEEQLEFADERPFGFALIDLDHFKAINDAVDKLLRKFHGIIFQKRNLADKYS